MVVPGDGGVGESRPCENCYSNKINDGVLDAWMRDDARQVLNKISELCNAVRRTPIARGRPEYSLLAARYPLGAVVPGMMLCTGESLQLVPQLRRTPICSFVATCLRKLAGLEVLAQTASSTHTGAGPVEQSLANTIEGIKCGYKYMATLGANGSLSEATFERMCSQVRKWPAEPVGGNRPSLENIAKGLLDILDEHPECLAWGPILFERKLESAFRDEVSRFGNLRLGEGRQSFRFPRVAAGEKLIPDILVAVNGEGAYRGCIDAKLYSGYDKSSSRKNKCQMLAYLTAIETEQETRVAKACKGVVFIALYGAEYPTYVEPDTPTQGSAVDIHEVFCRVGNNRDTEEVDNEIREAVKKAMRFLFPAESSNQEATVGASDAHRDTDRLGVVGDTQEHNVALSIVEPNELQGEAMQARDSSQREVRGNANPIVRQSALLLRQQRTPVNAGRNTRGRRTKNMQPGKRVINGRMYDSKNGLMCHQCRQKTASPLETKGVPRVTCTCEDPRMA